MALFLTDPDGFVEVYFPSDDRHDIEVYLKNR